jgi:hypothetical protein
MKTYSKRLWLNSSNNPSTGSVVAFSGKVQWRKKEKPEKTQFLELSDCHCKVRLHQTYGDSDKAYLKKIKKLKNFLGDYINYLEEN